MNPLPSGVELESSGDAEVMQDVFSGFAGAVGTAVPAVCQFSTSGDGYGGLAFVSGWGAAGTAGGIKVSRAVRFDWRGLADGNCDEKFDFVGGLGDCESAVRQADVRGDAGRGGGAVAVDFDDDDRGDSWELAQVSKLAARWRWW